MKRTTKILVAVMGIALVGATVARADHRSSGFGGGGCGPSLSYSSRSYDNFGGYGGSFGGSGYGGYGRGWSGSYGRGSSHSDYRPTQIQIHRGHLDVQPGHYDRFSTPQRGW